MGTETTASRHLTFASHEGLPIKAWVDGVDFEPEARAQVERIARLPFVQGWVAVMPDVHLGKGATVGSVVPTRHAIIPAAVGVDIGCGMTAVRTTLKASRLPDSLDRMRSALEAAIPHGRTAHGGSGDRGAWHHVPAHVASAWESLSEGWRSVVAKHPAVNRGQTVAHLGTLGGGNHFVELCIDEEQHVWLMLHSGSRGVGNRIGTYFIEKARERAENMRLDLEDRDLAWLEEGSPAFADYVESVSWAQAFARVNRACMRDAAMEVLRTFRGLPHVEVMGEVIDCHHNYVAQEVHGGESLYVTRKGAVRAGLGELGIIPGSMGAQSFIVRGKGSKESFESCSHGAGRRMSRTQARKAYTLADHERAVEGVSCRRDAAVLDETPAAYKPIARVMAAQTDLVEVVHTLKQVVCVKG